MHFKMIVVFVEDEKTDAVLDLASVVGFLELKMFLLPLRRLARSADFVRGTVIVRVVRADTTPIITPRIVLHFCN